MIGLYVIGGVLTYGIGLYSIRPKDSVSPVETVILFTLIFAFVGIMVWLFWFFNARTIPNWSILVAFAVGSIASAAVHWFAKSARE